MAAAPGIEARIAQARRENPGVAVDCYVLFASHTDALDLFQAARDEGVGARISPTPRAARASCGVALLISCDDAHTMEGIAALRSVPIEGIVPLPRQIDPLRDRYC